VGVLADGQPRLDEALHGVQAEILEPLTLPPEPGQRVDIGQ
jgi:hypothetical protein